MVDENYVRYKGRFKKKAPSRADHLKEFQFKKGESGNPKNRKMSENSLANLRPMPPWEPGQTGNPEGRPVGSISLVERLKAYLRRHPEEVEAIVVSLVKQGKIGNITATKELLDRVDGKVVERHLIEGEHPITIQFVPAAQSVIGTKPVPELTEGEPDL